MKLNKLIVILLAANGVLAQHKTTAKIETVKENGLHKIVLPPEIRSFSKEELGDFRIVDAKGTEIPYYILQGNTEGYTRSFSECKILSETRIPKSKTTLIFENPKATIHQIALSITNSDLTKTYSISGSDDQKEWFGLINNSLLKDLENSQDTHVLKLINIPLSSYRYLKIDFNDKKILPINVLKIGFVSTDTNSAIVDEITPNKIKIQQIPSEKKTRISINFRPAQIVNQLRFAIKSPNLFQRQAKIYIYKQKQTNRKSAPFPEELFTFELNSNAKTIVTIPQLFEKEWFIEIENQDNPPLTIEKIQLFQNQIAVVADLKANEKYSVTTQNPKLQSPIYDLENFKNSLDHNLPAAKIYDIKHLNSHKTSLDNPSIWQKPWFMWLCISLGGLTILYFTSRLVKDMKNNTPN
ncbi:hypothetical protein [Flavobacterium nackdongense]|uniref:DUF3999 family protein n=1 Tax=Flavobacterium nackdongense TaxID=2547394 RepID=A0A4V1AH08_9FLAO|nr:hypothetical protein [Flavobacterium nackdongense]QBN19892.1 hypothetical protein E1750_14145 [Flavobacterium nackdongense]